MWRDALRDFHRSNKPKPVRVPARRSTTRTHGVHGARCSVSVADESQTETRHTITALLKVVAATLE